MNLLRGMRQERRQQCVAVTHGLQRDVQDRAHALRVGLPELPGRLLGQVLVRLGDDPHRLGQRRLHAGAFEMLADGRERAGSRAQQLMVGIDKSTCRGTWPMFFAVNDNDRLTKLPHAATSSSLLRRTNSDQVKSVSWFSGPDADR